MITQNIIDEIIKKIFLKFNPKMVYIFGSFAYGNPHEDSDLDLLIIKDEIQNKIKEQIEIEKELLSKDYSVDILLYSENEYNQKLKEGWKIFEDINTKGILISA